MMLGVALLVMLLVLINTLEFTAVYIKNDRQHAQAPESSYWEAPESLLVGDEESVIIESPNEEESEILIVKKVLFEYVEVIDGCGVHFEGECLNVRSGPGTDFPVVARLRNDVILKVDGKVERDGHTWFKIIFDETLRYPERAEGDWYVAADFVNVVLDEGEKTVWEDDVATTTKRIVIDRSDQKLTAYDGDTLYMETPISTGLELTPTPCGTFTVYKKTPSRYMQGPLPGIADQFYDLPGVPWNLYFSYDGAVIHGAYWHNSFGSQYSHGCVNLPSDEAKKLYDWADLGMDVIVQE
ncbi:MAG: hypothetical protein A3E93_02795 [Candidatus Zambryskibacteria bacterium RIFCSPHIGHO2_12_FULL_43_12b]|nr:MAG: hypothetical protein A3E93_02795 [Candidatus Zambryskibacteria bacterium RIFCSPHIGHO2_12_FULL_43_12b]